VAHAAHARYASIHSAPSGGGTGRATITYQVNGAQHEASYYFDITSGTRHGAAPLICFVGGSPTSFISATGASAGWAIPRRLLGIGAFVAALVAMLVLAQRVYRMRGRSVFDL
jgi:hypothetical protein